MCLLHTRSYYLASMESWPRTGGVTDLQLGWVLGVVFGGHRITNCGPSAGLVHATRFCGVLSCVGGINEPAIYVTVFTDLYSPYLVYGCFFTEEMQMA